MFQRRLQNQETFVRPWDDYRQGFGNLRKEFWLGNDNLHRLSLLTPELLIQLVDNDGNMAHASYGTFFVGPESENYLVKVAAYTGSAGDSLSFHYNMPFSTIDVDNDEYRGSCPIDHQGAWWFKSCYKSHLNGRYDKNKKGITWMSWKGDLSLEEAAMKLRSARGKRINDCRYYSVNFNICRNIKSSRFYSFCKISTLYKCAAILLIFPDRHMHRALLQFNYFM